MKTQEAFELAEHDNMFSPITPDTDSAIARLSADYAQAKADQAELFLTRQYLLKAISLLPKRELKITLAEEATLGEQPFRLQAKFDELKGVTSFRAVKTFD